MRYTVLRPTGDYADRKREATEAGAVLYLEQHMNGGAGKYSLAKYLRGDERAEELAREYAQKVDETCPVVVGWRAWEMFTGEGSTEDTRRGYWNLYGTQCPAILMEPGFAGEPAFAAWVKTPAGILGLARCIVHVVRGGAPHGGVIALSVGHIGKTSSPHDRGAPVHGGGWEGEIAQRIVDMASALLATEVPPAPRPG